MNPLTVWFDALRFAADSQRVIALRMMHFATSGDAKVATEATRMVSEKITAMMDSQTAMMRAVIGGHQAAVVAQRGLTPYKRCVRANLARLSRD